MARLVSLLVAAAVATLGPAVSPGPRAAHAQKTPRERSTLSREAYDDGKKAYNLGDFDRAIELWKQGYEYKDDPIFLYNIAQAYRQRGDYQKAIFFYRAYTREDPRARNRADVEAQQNPVDTQPKEPVSPPPETPAESPPPAAAPPDAMKPAQATRDEASPPHPGRTLKIGGAVAGGVGVAGLATGVVFLLRSSSIESELEDRARRGEPWSAALVDRESQGRSAQTIGWIGVAAGGALVATGVTLYVLGMQKDRRARNEVSFGVLPSGRVVTLGAALQF